MCGCALIRIVTTIMCRVKEIVEEFKKKTRLQLKCFQVLADVESEADEVEKSQ